jgi:hypothetical protein
MVLCLYLIPQARIHFKLVSVEGVKVSRLIPLHVDIQLFQFYWFKEYPSPLYCLCSFVIDQLTATVRSISVLLF